MVAQSEQGQYWWERRWFIALLLLLAAVPLLWPDFPPMVDLPGHMGRYKVQLNQDDAALAQFYSFEWKLIANLGADILIIPFGTLFGIELGTKLIVILTMVATAAGLLWVAREVHGRIPPTAAFALPLIYSYVATFGFINYMLSMALAFNAFALWLYLERKEKTHLRSWIMIPLSFIIAITHIFGWGVLGILVFGWEFGHCLDRKDRPSMRTVIHAAWTAALRCLPLCGPIIMLLLWRSGGSAGLAAEGWFRIPQKLIWLVGVLRDRWAVFDTVSAIILLSIILLVRYAAPFHMQPRLKPALVILSALFVLFPFYIFGSAYSDMRLTPYLLALALIAIAPPRDVTFRTMQWVALAAFAFYIVRISANTVSYAIYNAQMKRELAALEAIPDNARLFSFVNTNCDSTWATGRTEHLSSIALVRKNAYANDQWAAAGAQLIRSKINAPEYEIDGSQFLPDAACKGDMIPDVRDIFAGIPRDKFDYIWMINIPPYNVKHLTGVTPIWADGNSAVFRIDHDAPNPQQLPASNKER